MPFSDNGGLNILAFGLVKTISFVLIKLISILLIDAQLIMLDISSDVFAVSGLMTNEGRVISIF